MPKIKPTIRKRNKLGQFAKSSPWTNNALVKTARRASYKLLALMLIIGLNSVGLSSVGKTMGFYNDIESSTENTFEAGSVDFLLGTSGWQATSTAVSMPPGDITKKEVTVFPEDSNPFQYFATSTNIAGDSDFCNGLLVTAKLEGVPAYNGPLVNLLTAATTTLDSWEFAYTTGAGDFQNRVCDFDIDYNGWQTRHDYPAYENGGFNDTEKISNRLSSWGFRINKVYYDVESPERGAEGANEWVEIYNQTNTDLDISGWEICDNISCDTLPSTPLIPAQKYAVIVATSTTATTTTVSNGLPSYWYLPSEVTQININNLIGNGLGNDADMLILKRPDGVIVDQMNWGEPDTGWTNYNGNVWNPGVVDAAEGNVLARVPSGYDTDQPSDWAELKPPSVDLIYPDEGGSYTWYWNHSYDIKWTALNNNGPNEDLDISIFYIKDVNHDTVISLGDTTHTIAETTNNDGLFNWTVPSGFIGYIWIQLVATGPENPMLNTGTVSGKIYDPFAIFVTGEEDALAEAPSTPDALAVVEEEAVPEPGTAPAVSEMASSTPDVAVEEEIITPTAASSTPDVIVEETTVSEPQPSPEVVAGEAEPEVAPAVEEEEFVALEPEVAPVVEETASSTPDAIAEETAVSEPESQSSPESAAGEAEITPAVEEAIIPEPEATVPEPAPVVEETPAKEEDIVADTVIVETDES